MKNTSEFLNSAKSHMIEIIFDDKDKSLVTLSSKIAGNKIPPVNQQETNTFLVLWDVQATDWICFEQEKVVEWKILL